MWMRNRDSVVTMLWAGRSGNCGSIPDTGDIYLLPVDWIWSWARQGYRGYFSGVEAAEVGSWPITFIQYPVQERVELCLLSSIGLHATNAHNCIAMPTLHELDWIEKSATILDKTTYSYVFLPQATSNFDTNDLQNGIHHLLVHQMVNLNEQCTTRE